MATIKGDGNPLTHQQMDENFQELNTARSDISTLQGSVNTLQGEMTDRTSRLGALENKVWGYTLLDVYNNVYKNMPNHTNDLSHARIRAFNYFQSSALASGMSDSDLDEFWENIKNESDPTYVLNRYGEVTQLSLVGSLIALYNSRVYQHIKWGTAGVNDSFYYDLDDLARGRSFPTLPDRSGEFNNLSASDGVIYSFLKQRSWTPFTWDMKIKGWNPT